MTQEQIATIRARLAELQVPDCPKTVSFNNFPHYITDVTALLDERASMIRLIEKLEDAIKTFSPCETCSFQADEGGIYCEKYCGKSKGYAGWEFLEEYFGKPRGDGE